MHIVYIHGNAATGESFNFIREHLRGHQDIVLEYDSTNGFYNNYAGMLERLSGLNDLFFIAHSLGGIYALHLANELGDSVRGAVTLSTPYGGSEAAQFVQYVLPFNQVLRDIQPHSAPIVDGHAVALSQPWVNVVSMRGHSPLMAAANDGVVTQQSMRYRRDMTLFEVDTGHYEILLSREAVDIIRNTLDSILSDDTSEANARMLYRTRVADANA